MAVSYRLTLGLCFLPGKVKCGAGGAAGRSSQEIINRGKMRMSKQGGEIASNPCLIRRGERGAEPGSGGMY